MEYTYREELANIYYDLYKDVHGFRPRWIYDENGPINTEEELKVMLDQLEVEAKRVFAEEKRREEAKWEEVQAKLAELIACGASDMATAKRWFVQSLGLDKYDLMYGGEYVCYTLGLDYKRKGEWEDACKAVSV